MFIRYLKDMKSWIFFFVFSLALTDLLIWLDKGIDVKASSTVYLNMLLLIVFITFLIWRYVKEMKFTNALHSLIEELDEDWVEALPTPLFLRDEVTNEVLRAVMNSSRRRLSELNNVHIIESDYTSAWVHEAKAPLTAMKLAIDANRSVPAIRKIEAEWLRVHLLIDQQLYISRLPTLETDYILEKTSVNQLVIAEVQELASWCMEKNVAIEIEGENKEIVTDSKWGRFIVRQLLTNAVKYSPDSGTIIISVAVKPSGNTVLTLKDEGPGIPPHDLPRIFDKGFTGGTGRLHNAATGLGLYLAQAVAGKIGITLAAQSKQGHGTTMQMTFSTENDFDKVKLQSVGSYCP
ncbi:sensor histidine kinase [Sporosarcina limicola]|uniref:histidine kinase n=1 Tax=Sporosarcina limicola TaxID=34101 RepID=A0A927MLB0_9BACL|nr:sensor histidine kinase [Sporosarcina limicola]MBE1555232.1 OmpR family two-component system bacitracin resistance sensor histidine kinase BceS [Sporosarcina limicola]